LCREKDGISACCHTCRDDRARSNAREGPGVPSSAGQAWKKVARWHELVGTQEKWPESLESAKCLWGGRDAAR